MAVFLQEYLKKYASNIARCEISSWRFQLEASSREVEALALCPKIDEHWIKWKKEIENANFQDKLCESGKLY